jgi:glycosyltransferase involved in cell wall biosynthesis
MAKKAVIIVTKGFDLKTGYYFRVIRDKELYESLGFEVDIIGINSKLVDKEFGKSYNFFCFYKFISKINSYDYIICENIGSSSYISFAHFLNLIKKNIKLLLVYHGSLDELKCYKFGTLKILIYTLFEKYSISHYSGIIVVSKIFENIIKKKYPEKEIKIITIPNYPGTEFIKAIDKVKLIENYEKLKDILEIPLNKKIFTFSGNTQVWQNLDFIINLYSNILLKDNNVFFIFLTTQIENMKKIIGNRLPIKNYLIKKVENSVIPKYLIISDFLVVIRAEDKINEVACPTKAIEYILSDSPIIVSDSLGDITNIIKQTGNGVVVSQKENNKEIIEKIFKYNKDSEIKRNTIIPLTFNEAKNALEIFIKKIENKNE